MFVALIQLFKATIKSAFPAFSLLNTTMGFDQTYIEPILVDGREMRSEVNDSQHETQHFPIP